MINKSILKKSLYTILTIMSAFVFMECIVHFTDRSSYDSFLYDEESGLLVHRPNTINTVALSCLTNKVHFNSLGFYGPEISPKQPDEYRIMILGGSLVESLQVPLQKRLDNLLQEKLNQNNSTKKYKVISVGFAGNGTFLNMLYFKKFEKAIQPDLVIDLMTNYDFGVDAPEVNHAPYFDDKGNVVTELPKTRRNPTRLFIQGMMRSSKLTMNVYYKYMAAKDLIKKEKNNVATDIESTIPVYGSWDTEDKLFQKFAELVKADGAKFLVMSWSQDGIIPRNFVQSNFEPLMKKNKINTFDITANLDDVQKQIGSLTWTCDGHWNEAGHVAVANKMYSYLMTRPDLLK